MRNIIFLAFLCCVNIVAAQQVTKQFLFSETDIQINNVSGYDIVRYDDESYISGINFFGKPMLPLMTYSFILPPGAVINNVICTVNSQQQLLQDFYIYPVQDHVNELFLGNSFIEPDPSVYGSNDPYPANNIIGYETHGYRQYNYVSVNLVPFRYLPLSKQLFLLTDITINISYQVTTTVSKEKMRSLSYEDVEANSFVRSIIVNSSDFDGFYTQVNQELQTFQQKSLQPVESKAFLPVSFPSEFGSEVKYLIITNNTDVNGNSVGDFVSAFQQLADWKTKTGVPSVVIKVDDINSHYQGVDIQEKIREFIKDAHYMWGVESVLLGGDVSIIPSRLSNFTYKMNSDLYYSAIYSTTWGYTDNWNYDRNNEFFASGDFIPYSSNNPDYTPDILLGRAPVDNLTELNTFLQKCFTFYRCSFATGIPSGNYLDKQLNLAGIVYYDTPCDINSDELGLASKKKVISLEESADQYNLMEYSINPPTGCDLSQYYDPLIMNGELNRNNVLSQINSGQYGIIDHLDHSNFWSLGTGASTNGTSLIRTDIMNLSNGPYYSVFYSAGCEPAAFEKEDCIGENWLLSPNGGGPVFIGPCIGIGTVVGNQHDYKFFNRLYTYHDLVIGSALRNASSTEYQYRIYQLLGDPQLSVYTDVPNDLTVSHPSNIQVGTNSVSVYISAVPVTGTTARVCLFKAGEVYAYAETSGGNVVFNINPHTAGTIKVTVTAPNCNPYEGQINVIDALLNIYVFATAVDDDITPPSNGNNDLKINPGETIELALTLKKTGLQSPGVLTGYVEYIPGTTPAPTPNLVSNLTPTLISFNSAGLDEYVGFCSFIINNEAVDGESIHLKVHVNNDALYDAFTDDLYLQIHAPLLERKMVSYTITNDDGDGIIEAGENVVMNIEIFNSGNAPYINTLASLKYSSVEIASGQYGIIQPLTTETSDSPLSFTATATYTGQFTLALTDAYGKVNYFPFILQSSQTTNLLPISFTSTSSSINLTWSPVTPLINYKGYNVYRSTNPSSGFLKVNSLPVPYSYYLDEGLSHTTTYYYRVAPITNYGIECNLSPSVTQDGFKAWTTIPYHTGWPVVNGTSIGQAAGSPVVFDINNDGLKEIFCVGGTSWAGGAVYAFKHNGEPLFGQSSGSQFNTFADINAQVVYCTPAIGDIDNDGIFEIVVTTRNAGDANEKSRVIGYKIRDNNNDLKGDLWFKTEEISTFLKGAVLTDMNDDGILEILVKDEYGGSINLFNVNVNGDITNYSSDWPKNIGPGSGQGMPVAIDFDKDPITNDKEIAIGLSGNGWFDGTNFHPFYGGLFILNDDGTNYNGTNVFPYAPSYAENYDNNTFNGDSDPLYQGIPEMDNMDSPPVVADINKDGYYDIFFISSPKVNPKAYIHAVEKTINSTPSYYANNLESYYVNSLPGWSTPVQNIPYSGSLPVLSLGDVNNDGEIEIIAVGYGRINVWDKSGIQIYSIVNSNINSGWNPPLIADVDGDNMPEIITTKGNAIYAFRLDGTIPVGWPVYTNISGIPTPCISDIDGDGKSELIAVASDGVYVWKTQGNPLYIEWGSNRHDCYNSGIYSGISISSSYESCPDAHDGTASVSVTTGVPPYSYLWDDENNSTTQTITGLSQGIYQVLVTDNNGNTLTNQVQVILNPYLFNYTGPANIDVNTNWNAVDYKIGNNIEVGTNAILKIENGSNIQFGLHNGIIIKPGGKVIVDNSTITSLAMCGDMWQGIEVRGNSSLSQTYTNQGVIEIKNEAIIENAYIAINAKAGAIVKAENCSLRNNVTGVKFDPYNNFNPVTLAPRINLSSFKNCTFETTMQLNDNTQYPEAFVLLNGVNGIDFLGNTFQNTVPSNFVVTKRGIGIKSINSGYNVNAYCTSTMSPCPPTQYNKNEFIGLCYGIYAQNTTSIYPVIVNRSNFTNNNRGIFMSGVNNPTITLNNFDVGATEYISDGISPPPPYKSTTPTTMVLPGFGMFLYKIQTFNVQENEFYSTHSGYYGSIIWSCGTIAKDFYNNNYSDLKVGFQSSSNNSGLQIKCNEFIQNLSVADIGITSGSIAINQGKCVLDYYLLPAGNLFSHTGGNAFDIKANNNVTPFYYHYHNGSPTTPFTYTSGIVTLNQCMADYSPEACPSRLNTGNTTTQLLANITSYNNEISSLSSNIDGGSTQVMLDKVNATMNSAQLKNELLDAGLLSDTVMIATLTRTQPLTPGHIKEILVPNSPLTDKVIKVLNQQTLPPGIKSEIQEAQTGESARAILEQQISAIEAERTLAVSELIQLYAEDTTGTGLENIIAFLETQPDVNSKQMLVQAYYSSGECSEAQIMLDQLPKLSSDERDFYTLYSILAELCTAGNTVYDLSPAQKQVVETLALSNSMVAANAQAIMSQVYGNWYWEKIEELLDFNTVTIKGTLFGNPDCDNAPVANDTILLVDDNGEAVLGVNPVVTNENGEFIFSPNELLVLDSTATYTLKTKSGFALAEQPYQLISEWINQSPLSLSLKNVNLEWYDLYDSPDSIGTIGTCIDINGNIYVAGRTSRTETSYDVVLIKYSPIGTRLWQKIYDSGKALPDYPDDMTLDKDGNCYLSISSENANVILLKYNSEGQLLWEKNIENSANLFYYSKRIKINKSNEVVVAGDVFNLTTNANYIFTTLYDVNGNRKWFKTINITGLEYMSDMIIDKFESVLITGITNAANLSSDAKVLTLKLNKNGNISWTKTYDMPPYQNQTSYERGFSLACDNQGNVYIIGTSSTQSTGGILYDNLIFVLKYSSNGNFQWINNLTRGYEPQIILANSSENLYCLFNTSNHQISISKIDFIGNITWNNTYQAGLNYGSGSSITLDNNDNIYITGNTRTFIDIYQIGSRDYMHIMIMSLNNVGQENWKEKFAIERNSMNSGNDIVVSENGNVYITGYSSEPFDYYSLITLKYSQCPSLATLRSNIFSDTENSGSDIQVINFKENTITVYPNPYSDNTLIELVLNSDADVSLEVYTMTGQCVANVYTGPEKVGTYTYEFSAKKLGYSAGTYILKATVNNEVSSYWLVEMK